MNAEIALTGISKRYEGVEALHPFDLSIASGETFGIIGPDGGGKSTILRILATLLLPDSGQGTVAGHDLVRDFRQIRRSIGYMPQRFSLYPDLTVKENMRFFSEIFGMKRKEFAARMEELLEFNALGSFLDRKAAALSGGMKQKLALSCVLIHTPQLVILDEPTTGVDPVSRQEFWHILGQLREQGLTLLVTTPYMDEAMKCDRVCLLNQGQRLLEAPPEELTHDFPYSLLTVRGPDLLNHQAALQALPSVESVVSFGDRLHLYTRTPEALEVELAEYEGNWALSISVGSPSIEDVFVHRVELANQERGAA